MSNENPKFPKNKKEHDLRNEFYKHLNTHFRLTGEEEKIIVDLNMLITNSARHGDIDSKDKIITKTTEDSEILQKVKANLKEVTTKKEAFNKIKEEIEESFDKLRLILDSRNELTNVLKDFNTSTQTVIKEKEKIIKLNKGIDAFYKMYENAQSIQAFFENTKEDCVEKIRFLSDYEEIENGINFFTINHSYIESDNYLNTYNMLKRIALTRYFNYMANSIQVSSSSIEYSNAIELNDSLFRLIMTLRPNNLDSRYYYLPKNYEKTQDIQIFFEKKGKYDLDIKKALERIKTKFISKRLSILKPCYDLIFKEIQESFNGRSHKSFKHTIQYHLREIFKITLCEVFYFSLLFQTKIEDNIYILQTFTSELYDYLYAKLRPIIVSTEILDHLLSLYDSISSNMGIFFIDIDQNIKDDFIPKVIEFIDSLNEDRTQEISEDAHKHHTKFFGLIQISKKLIRPTIMKLIQDIQEKIFFRVNHHVKSNLNEIEEDVSNFAEVEITTAVRYEHFSLYHHYLRRLTILVDILRSKLDKKILNELIVIAIERFISLLNEQIFNKKILTYDFEIYIIQQILLCIQILNAFKVEGTDTAVEVDLYSLSDVLKVNIQSVLNNQFSFSDMLSNSTLKVSDKTRDFKKILYNNLLKSYKILINLVNEFVLGREVMNMIFQIRNNTPRNASEINMSEIIKTLKEIQTRYVSVVSEIKNQLLHIDHNAGNKISTTITDNLSNYMFQIKVEFDKIEDKNSEEAIGILNEINLNIIKETII